LSHAIEVITMSSDTTPSTAIVPAPQDHGAARRPRRAGQERLEPLWMTIFDPARFGTLRQMAGILLRSGFLPKTIRTEEQVITILVKGYELGIPPMEALTGITVIDGKPAVSPQLMLALINRSGQLQDLAIDGDDGRCRVTMTRRGRRAHTETFTLDDARRMGLADKSNWRQQPRVMLRWRAVSACARVVFPDVVSGLYTPEEMGATVVVDEDGAMRVADHGDGPGDTRGGSARGDPVDPETGEVVGAPTAGPADTPRTAPAAARSEPAAPQDPAPAQRDGEGPTPAADAAAGGHGPSADTPSPAAGTALTREERHALQLLVAQAARADGLAGRTPGQDWLERHYGARSLERLTDRLDDVRERAMAVLSGHEQHTQSGPPSTEEPRTPPESGTRTAGAHSAGQTPPAGTGTGPDGEIAAASPSRPARLSTGEFRALIHKAAVVQRVKSATPGKTWLRERYGTDNPSQLTDAQYEDAVRQARAVVTAVARGPELASPGSLAWLEAAFDRLQYDEPGRAGLIRACTNDRTDRAEEMTEVEIRALIDELGGPAPGTSVDAPAATPPPAA
jgi:hypothetical protein